MALQAVQTHPGAQITRLINVPTLKLGVTDLLKAQIKCTQTHTSRVFWKMDVIASEKNLLQTYQQSILKTHRKTLIPKYKLTS